MNVTVENKTKKTVMELNPNELGLILKTAIDHIDQGSVESVDKLVRKQLEKV